MSAALSPQAGPKNAAPMTPCFAEHDIPLNRILTERGTEYRSVPTAGLLATFSVGRAAERAAQNQLGFFSGGYTGTAGTKPFRFGMTTFGRVFSSMTSFSLMMPFE